MNNKKFEEISASIPNFYNLFADKSLEIIDEIYLILKKKGISQKELAKRLKKEQSEVSKWLSGGHNLTLMTISKLEDALGEEIIVRKSRAIEVMDFQEIQSDTKLFKSFSNKCYDRIDGMEDDEDKELMGINNFQYYSGHG